jgi:MFS family permease
MDSAFAGTMLNSRQRPNHHSAVNLKKSNPSSLLVIMFTVFLDLVGFSIIFPLFPDMLEYYLGKEAAGGWFHSLIVGLESFSGESGAAARFAATVFFGGLLGSLYSLLQFVTAPIWGALSDQVGRRRILIITVGGTMLSYLLWICADAFWLLIASRLLGGAMAGNLSVATAAIADVTDSSSRAKGMGLIGAAFGLGFVIGPAFGALLSVVDAQNALSFIPGINPFSVPAIAAFLLSLANLLFLIKVFPETLNLAQAAKGRARRPINPLAVLKPSPFPGVNLTNLAYFVFIAAFAGMEFTITFLAKDRFDYSSIDNGKLFLFLGILIVVVQGGVVRRVVPRYGEKNVVIAGSLIVLPGMFLLAFSYNEFLMYVALFLLAVGSSLVTPSLNALVSLYTPADQQGVTLGVFRSLGSLARALAPLAGAAAYWRFGSESPYIACGFLILIPLLLSARLHQPSKND